MQIGLFSTFMSPIADAEMITQFAQDAEAAGVDSLWMGEHVVLFDETEFPYPGTADGKLPVPPGGGMLDTVATFGFLAAATSKLRFGTGITLISQRNPLYTAKEFATLDWLSGGRIDFGVGVGWCKEEVIASGYGWEDRGQRANEFLELLKLFWTEELTSYDGQHFQVQPCRMDPKPRQTPHIPIIVGGHSKAGLQRAARYGDGWYGFGLNPKYTEQAIADVRATLDAQGRSAEDFQIVITPSTFRNDDVRAFADLGVDQLVLHLGSQKPENVARRLDEVATLVAQVS